MKLFTGWTSDVDPRKTHNTKQRPKVRLFQLKKVNNTILSIGGNIAVYIKHLFENI